MRHTNLARLLRGGDRRSIGRSAEAADLTAQRPQLARQLVALLRSDDELLRMRASDALEKASAAAPALLAPFKSELLDLMAQASQKELRWHLAQMAPRLPLATDERLRAIAVLECYLDDRSSIVRTFAMQALADLAAGDLDLLNRVAPRIEAFTRTGTPAMRARGRKLLTRLSALRKHK